ncbi:hypothetical protein ABE51_31100, partial [Bacillus thuringiensis]|nr:hypothetical protein [Bacillus thuringiensis]MBG9524860.1 hypothetical protein [Bacillus thuringiensis]MBG9524874.1 hypothetical protein [Bacillus thuringiensis]MBG9525002.1 hypothetical protein [Bacillus thuringiensis]MBG9526041.1 hypothetical protein [Bacillus thuringiensis]
MEHRMVGGRALLTDSTHIKANANKNKLIKQVQQVHPKEYLEELETAVTADRIQHGKKHLYNERKMMQKQSKSV